MHRIALATAVAASVSLGFAASLHAQDAGAPEKNPSLEAQREALVKAEAELIRWARTEEVDSPLREEVRLTAAAERFLSIKRPLTGPNALSGSELRESLEQCQRLQAEAEERRRSLLQPDQELAMFDVRSIIGLHGDFPGPRIGASPSDHLHPQLTFGDGPRPGEGVGLDADKLKEVIDCRLGLSGNDIPCEISNGTLLVRGTPEKIARVRSFLDFLRKWMPGPLELDVRAYRMPAELRAELARLSTGFALAPSAEELLAKAERAGLVELLGAQRLEAQDGQKVSAWLGEASSYVAGLEPRPGGQLSLPWPGAARTGVVAELQTTVDHDRRNATVEVSFQMGERGKVAKELVSGTEIELPQMALLRLATSVSLPLGRAGLVAGTFTASGTAGEKLASVLYLRVSSEQKLDAAPSHTWSPPAWQPRIPESLPAETRAEVARLTALIDVLRSLDGVRQVYRLSIFDVRDVLEARPWRTAPSLGIQTGGLTFADAEESSSAIEPDKLIELLKSMTGAEEAWGDPASGDLHRGQVIVHQTDAVRSRIEAILASQRRLLGGLAEVDAARYELDPSLLAEIETISRNTNGGTSIVLPKAALARLDDAATRKHGARLLSSGFLVARGDERSVLFLGDERSYVKGYDEGMTPQATPRAPADGVCGNHAPAQPPAPPSPPVGTGCVSPQIGSVRAGLTLLVAPTTEHEPAGGPDRLRVTIRHASCRFIDMSKSTTPHGPVMSPVVEQNTTAQVDHVFEPETGLLLVSKSLSPGGNVLVTVLRARALETQAKESAGTGSVDEQLSKLRDIGAWNGAGGLLERVRAGNTATLAALLVIAAFALAIAKTLARYARARKLLLADAPRFVEQRLRAGSTPGSVLGEWSFVAEPLVRWPHELLIVAGLALGLGALAKDGVAPEASLGLGPTMAVASLLAYSGLATLLGMLGAAARKRVLVVRNEVGSA